MSNLRFQYQLKRVDIAPMFLSVNVTPIKNQIDIQIKRDFRVTAQAKQSQFDSLLAKHVGSVVIYKGTRYKVASKDFIFSSVRLAPMNEQGKSDWGKNSIVTVHRPIL